MLWERVISAIVGILLFILFIFWGSLPFAFFLSLILSIALYEYNRMIPGGDKENYLFLLVFSLFIITYTYLNSRGFINLNYGLPVFLILPAYFLYYIWKKDYGGLLSKLGYNLLALFYITGGMVFFLLLRDFQNAPFNQTRALWLVLIATWSTDTGAYFTGRFWGKRKLAAKISPNKTIEGAWGGIIFSILAVLIYVYFLNYFSFYWLIYGLLVALISIAGDLFESSIKREVGVKDSGELIPGHGGVLDRFDSLLFAAPFTYYFLSLLF